ncbi:MAG: hypothetical protein KGL39_58500 [Patescibacteria group bacterium]|nr:hypothetical protein [Patescibacteria group bacterium]
MTIQVSDKAKALQALEAELWNLEEQSKRTLRHIATLRHKFLLIGDCQIAVMDAIERLKREGK